MWDIEYWLSVLIELPRCICKLMIENFDEKDLQEWGRLLHYLKLLKITSLGWKTPVLEWNNNLWPHPNFLESWTDDQDHFDETTCSRSSYHTSITKEIQTYQELENLRKSSGHVVFPHWKAAIAHGPCIYTVKRRLECEMRPAPRVSRALRESCIQLARLYRENDMNWVDCAKNMHEKWGFYKPCSIRFGQETLQCMCKQVCSPQSTMNSVNLHSSVCVSPMIVPEMIALWTWVNDADSMLEIQEPCLRFLKAVQIRASCERMNCPVPEPHLLAWKSKNVAKNEIVLVFNNRLQSPPTWTDPASTCEHSNQLIFGGTRDYASRGGSRIPAGTSHCIVVQKSFPHWKTYGIIEYMFKGYEETVMIHVGFEVPRIGANRVTLDVSANSRDTRTLSVWEAHKRFCDHKSLRDSNHRKPQRLSLKVKACHLEVSVSMLQTRLQVELVPDEASLCEWKREKYEKSLLSPPE